MKDLLKANGEYNVNLGDYCAYVDFDGSIELGWLISMPTDETKSPELFESYRGAVLDHIRELIQQQTKKLSIETNERDFEILESADLRFRLKSGEASAQYCLRFLPDDRAFSHTLRKLLSSDESGSVPTLTLDCVLASSRFARRINPSESDDIYD